MHAAPVIYKHYKYTHAVALYSIGTVINCLYFVLTKFELLNNLYIIHIFATLLLKNLQ